MFYVGIVDNIWSLLGKNVQVVTGQTDDSKYKVRDCYVLNSLTIGLIVAKGESVMHTFGICKLLVWLHVKRWFGGKDLKEYGSIYTCM